MQISTKKKFKQGTKLTILELTKNGNVKRKQEHKKVYEVLSCLDNEFFKLGEGYTVTLKEIQE